MKKVTFAHFCEDVSQRVFLENALKQFPAQNKAAIEFILNEEFVWTFKPRTKAEVLDNYSDASIKAFAKYKVDVFFIGMDYDDWDQSAYKEKHLELGDVLDKSIRTKTIIFLPIQAVEHWLCYLKQKIDNPQTTKLILQEGKNRRAAKDEIYGTTRPSSSLSETKVNELTTPIDFGWLCNHSKSFNHFYKQLEAFAATA